MLNEPRFFESEFVYVDNDGWHIKDEAPQELKDEFNEFFRLAKGEVQDEKTIRY